MKKTADVLIVGGGPAGYTAGLYAARAGLTALVLEALAPGGQMGTTEAVDNYPGTGTVDGSELAERMRRDAEQSGAETVMAQATALDLSGRWKLAETAGGTYGGRALIYAAGAAPRTLDIPGEPELRGRGVSYCAACDGAFFRGRDVVVAGGGNSAAAEALTLSFLCRKVYLLHRRDQLRAEHSYQQALKRTKNVEFLWNARLEAVLGEAAVTGVRYTDIPSGAERTLPCAGLFVAVGRTPNTALLAGQVTLDQEGYVEADETTRTSLPGVFAAGDVRKKPFRQIVTAAADGAVAAHFAAEYLQGQT